MRLTVMSQLTKSIEADDQPNLSAEIEKELECLKWNLWHGNVHKALQIVEDLEVALDLEENSQEQRRLLKAVLEFGTTSFRTEHSSRTTAIVTGTERPSRQASLSQPSINS